MIKRSTFNNPILPYLLILPQVVITVLFFFYPAAEALIGSFMLTDPFGQDSHFIFLDNFKYVFEAKEYWQSFLLTLLFSVLTAVSSMSMGLFLATLANRVKRFKIFIRTIFIWPYAVAPAIAGILWLFLFHPTYGVIGYFLKESMKWGWNPVLNGNHALFLVIMASSWKQVSYNFVFFLSGLQSVPKSVIEAATIDGASPIKRFWVIVIPMLSPIMFFLLVMNLVYAFFDTFGVIHTITEGGPGGATNILVYKVYSDGFVGLDLGSSAAQSVVLMLITILLTFIQFKYVEKKVSYN